MRHPLAHAPARRRLLAAGAAGLGLAALGAPHAQTPAAAPAPSVPGRRARLRLSGPPAAVSFPLMRLADSQALADVADQVEFTLWKNPDQLRAQAIEQSADFVAMPSNVAANLYNRGVPLRLLDISAWGLLWMVSREQGLRTLADFRGKEVVMPFRGDMPDIVFRLLATRQGLEIGKDIVLRYVASPLDAMQLLVMRRADHALLAEPAVSVALRKSHSFPIDVVAPELYRSVDLQEEWGRVLGRAPRIPQAGMTAAKALLGDAALLARFERAYTDALRWCQAEPAACGRMVARHVPMLAADGVADSVRIDKAAVVSAADARAELEFFYGLLLEQQPGLVGGKLPAAGFYG
ncbi:MAG: ABC transporter substrate-binding protein [Proteobacteria bacterium]|jgi:NitT/TauT family transport system substrate-binding protein|nr:ABC transporter substrate-binding protein [Pseudomonadota bacterium]